MKNNFTQRIIRNIFENRQSRGGEKKSHGGVRQDKYVLSRERVAAAQVVTDLSSPRTQPVTPKLLRSRNGSSTKRKRTYIMLWVEPVVKAELERRAQRNGLSVSATGATLLKRALQQNIDMEYGALLEPIIRQEIRRQMANFSSRIALLLARNAFSSEQTRNLVTNILARQPEAPQMSEDTLNRILDSSADAAKHKITAKTPQLERILTEIKGWFKEKLEEK